MKRGHVLTEQGLYRLEGLQQEAVTSKDVSGQPGSWGKTPFVLVKVLCGRTARAETSRPHTACSVSNTTTAKQDFLALLQPHRLTAADAE